MAHAHSSHAVPARPPKAGLAARPARRKARAPKTGQPVRGLGARRRAAR